MARRSRPQQGPIQPATATPHAPALPFPVEVFPTPLRRFIREVAEALPFLPDFVGVPLLAVLGTAIGTSRVLEVKPGWLEGPRLFAAVVAEPGSKKSPALALVMQPVRERQQRLQAAAQHARPAEEGDDVQPSGGLPLVGDPGETPPVSSRIMPQLYTTDATLEALIQLLHQNPRGLLFVRDELTGWILGMNMCKNSKGNDRQHWLSLWNGADILVNSKTRKEVTVVPNPFVCVTGCLPTEVISDLEDARGRRDGLLARLLFAVPDPVPLRWTETSVTEATMAGYTQLLEALWQLAPEGDSAARQGSYPVTLSLTHQGRAAFVQGVNAVYAQLADPDLPDDVRDVYAKLPGTMARLALILHACHGITGKANEAVDVPSVHGAVQLVRYFQGHAQRVYARLPSTRADQRAETALRWLQAHDGACTVRDLQRHRVAGLTRASQAEKLLRDLVDLGPGELRERRLPSGRTQRVFVLHTHAES
jgi:hypothetical protein